MKNTLFILFLFSSFNLCFSQTDTTKVYPNAMIGFWSIIHDRPNNKLTLTKSSKEESPIGYILEANGNLHFIRPIKCGNELPSRRKEHYTWYVEKETLNIVLASVKYNVIEASNKLVVLSKIKSNLIN